MLKVREEKGLIFSYASNADIFQLELVTQRVKEQKVSFVGFVNYVKSNDKTKDKGPIITSQVDLESTEDKSKVVLFVKHSRKIDLKQTVRRGFVVLIKEAYRKISN